MVLIFSHNNRSLVANWWWTVDKTLLACISILIVLGILLTFSASPAVATRIGFDSYHFIKRHLFFAPLAYMVMIALSMQKLKFIRRLSLVGYLAAIALVVCTFFFGEANKGAARWLMVFGFSLQPSEFVKPFSLSPPPGCLTANAGIRNFPAICCRPPCFCLPPCSSSASRTSA